MSIEVFVRLRGETLAVKAAVLPKESGASRLEWDAMPERSMVYAAAKLAKEAVRDALFRLGGDEMVRNSIGKDAI